MTLPIELGPRAAEIMRFMWSSKQPVSGRTIYTLLRERHNLAYTTVTTILYRLVDQGLLHRECSQSGAVSLYSPTCSREAYVQQAMARINVLVGLDV